MDLWIQILLITLGTTIVSDTVTTLFCKWFRIDMSKRGEIIAILEYVNKNPNSFDAREALKNFIRHYAPAHVDDPDENMVMFLSKKSLEILMVQWLPFIITTIIVIFLGNVIGEDNAPVLPFTIPILGNGSQAAFLIFNSIFELASFLLFKGYYHWKSKTAETINAENHLVA